MTPKEYYKTYRADDKLSDLSRELLSEVMKYDPIHVLDFGCGTGKHLSPLNGAGVCTIGIDVSPMNCMKAIHKYDLPCIICGDETYLRNLANVDVVFTCSVLDHIENVEQVINQLKRISNKAVILAETSDYHVNHYFRHDYKKFGFMKGTFSWVGEDGATYHVWVWNKIYPSSAKAQTIFIPHRQ